MNFKNWNNYIKISKEVMVYTKIMNESLRDELTIKNKKNYIVKIAKNFENIKEIRSNLNDMPEHPNLKKDMYKLTGNLLKINETILNAIKIDEFNILINAGNLLKEISDEIQTALKIGI